VAIVAEEEAEVKNFSCVFFVTGWFVKLPNSLRAHCYGRVIKRQLSHLNVVGPQVRKWRERKGWTQGYLALKLQLFGWDTSRESVTALENQRRRVPDLELYVLGRILGVKLEELFPRQLRARIKQLWPNYRAKLSRGQLPPG